MKEPGITIDPIETEESLTDVMSEPSPEAVDAVSQIAGDMMILGIAGKMGPTLGRLLVRAGAPKVIGVSRFSKWWRMTPWGVLSPRGVCPVSIS